MATSTTPHVICPCEHRGSILSISHMMTAHIEDFEHLLSLDPLADGDVHASPGRYWRKLWPDWQSHCTLTPIHARGERGYLFEMTIAGFPVKVRGQHANSEVQGQATAALHLLLVFTSGRFDTSGVPAEVQHNLQTMLAPVRPARPPWVADMSQLQITDEQLPCSAPDLTSRYSDQVFLLDRLDINPTSKHAAPRKVLEALDIEPPYYEFRPRVGGQRVRCVAIHPKIAVMGEGAFPAQARAAAVLHLVIFALEGKVNSSFDPNKDYHGCSRPKKGENKDGTAPGLLALRMPGGADHADKGRSRMSGNSGRPGFRGNGPFQKRDRSRSRSRSHSASRNRSRSRSRGRSRSPSRSRSRSRDRMRSRRSSPPGSRRRSISGDRHGRSPPASRNSNRRGRSRSRSSARSRSPSARSMRHEPPVDRLRRRSSASTPTGMAPLSHSTSQHRPQANGHASSFAPAVGGDHAMHSSTTPAVSTETANSITTLLAHVQVQDARIAEAQQTITALTQFTVQLSSTVQQLQQQVNMLSQSHQAAGPTPAMLASSNQQQFAMLLQQQAAAAAAANASGSASPAVMGAPRVSQPQPNPMGLRNQLAALAQQQSSQPDQRQMTVEQQQALMQQQAMLQQFQRAQQQQHQQGWMSQSK